MTSNIVAKIIMLPSGSVHIALANRESVIATVNSIDELLTNTPLFLGQSYQDFVSTTKEIYPENDPETDINELPALTLCDVYQNYRYDVLFPVVYHIWKNKSEEKGTTPIDMRTYIRNNSMRDPTVLFLRFYMVVVEAVSSNLFSKFNLNLEMERIERIIAEIIRTLLILSCKYNQSKEKSSVPMPSEISTPSTTEVQLSSPKSPKKKGKTPQKKKVDIQIASIDESSYIKVQNILKKNYSFSDEVRKYIRSLEEAQYYASRLYKEVLWDGQSALIPEINLNYFCISQGKTNKEIIMGGGSPVVPGDETNVYHIHHVGQNKKSPFAIIPKNDHNINFYSVFHDTKTKSEDLHTNSFEIVKRAFWKNYVKTCEKYGGFANIPSAIDVGKKKGR